MTIYQKQLARQIEERFAGMSTGELIEKLFQMGVVDFTRCKVLAIRQAVEGLVRQGEKKTDAMWLATEQFACSYEYVRKCVYYYTDVNM